jgi:hypothetical protein
MAERAQYMVEIKLGIMRKGDLTMAFIEQDGGKPQPLVAVPTGWIDGNPSKTAEREAVLADLGQRIIDDIAADHGTPVAETVRLNPDGTRAQFVGEV